MPLGRICPGCKRIVTGPCSCRPGGKRLTPKRRRNQKVWSSSAHRKQRLRVFARDGWACLGDGLGPCPFAYVDETETGKGLIADHVDGIDEVREFDDEELATRCRVCSGKKDGQRAGRG